MGRLAEGVGAMVEAVMTAGGILLVGVIVEAIEAEVEAILLTEVQCKPAAFRGDCTCLAQRCLMGEVFLISKVEGCTVEKQLYDERRNSGCSKVSMEED